MKPLFLFDGECGFCRAWTEIWQRRSGGKVDFAPFQQRLHEFPDLTAEECSRSAQYIDAEGKRLSGAAGIFKMLAFARGWGWLDVLYRRLPGFAFLTETGYRLVASNRAFFSRLMPSALPEKNYSRSAFWFLRGLGLIYAIAFISFGVQVKGLIGSGGIQPAADLLKMVSVRYGAGGFWVLPSVFWLNASDTFLVYACWAGALAGLAVFFQRRLMLPGLVLAWVLYVSFVNAALEFMSFQWDILLIETGFLAVFLAPWTFRAWKTESFRPSRLVLLLLKLLLFRLMFFSGFVKWISNDPSWHQLTALSFHYETQPLPNALSWYAHQLPLAVHKLCTVVMFVIELAVPFLFFVPLARIRRGAAFATIGLQVLILLTGNYTFFNLLTILLCLLLLDDGFWLRTPAVSRQDAGSVCSTAGSFGSVRNAPALVLIAVFVLCLSLTGYREGARMGLRVPQQHWTKIFTPYHLVNTYGLFAVMTTERPEIIVEGSMDGRDWEPFLFKYQPQDLKRRPRQAAPHQPRLDWQMWFAALGDIRQNSWFLRFAEKLLQGSPDVRALLAKDSPFQDRPPRFLRARLFDYRFTTPAEKSRTGEYWRRREIDTYLQPITLS